MHVGYIWKQISLAYVKWVWSWLCLYCFAGQVMMIVVSSY